MDSNKRKNCKPVKLLGIHLESKSNWEFHVINVSKKDLELVISYVSRPLVLLGYVTESLFCPISSHLIYGITLWGNSNAVHWAILWQKRYKNNERYS